MTDGIQIYNLSPFINRDLVLTLGDIDEKVKPIDFLILLLFMAENGQSWFHYLIKLIVLDSLRKSQKIFDLFLLLGDLSQETLDDWVFLFVDFDLGLSLLLYCGHWLKEKFN